jgi:hypothetical protein
MIAAIVPGRTDCASAIRRPRRLTRRIPSSKESAPEATAAVLAEAVPGDEIWLEARFAGRFHERQREREERGLGDVRLRQRLLRPLEREATDLEARGLVGGIQVALVQIRVGRERVLAHPGLLRALPWKQERDLAHPVCPPVVESR